MVNTFERFQAWAAANRTNIEPPFIVTEHRRSITGDREVLLKTPVMCLAQYDEDTIVGIYPCQHESGDKKIDTALTALESSMPPTNRETQRSTA